MDKIKLCKDCEHCQLSFGLTKNFRIEFAKCDSDETRKRYTGANGDLRYASTAREYHCGKEAKYFTPRKSLWQRVKGWFK